MESNIDLISDIRSFLLKVERELNNSRGTANLDACITQTLDDIKLIIPKLDENLRETSELKDAAEKLFDELEQQNSIKNSIRYVVSTLRELLRGGA